MTPPAALTPQDLTLSDMTFAGAWLPSDVAACAGLTALRLRDCCSSDSIPATPPATRLPTGNYLRHLRELCLVDFRFAEIPPVLSAAAGLRSLTCTNKAPRVSSALSACGKFRAEQAAEVLARLPRLGELRVAACDWSRVS